MQPGLFHRDPLIAIDFVRVDDIQQRANSPAANHVFVVCPSSSRPRGLTRRILHQLPHFFVQRHALQTGFHSGVESGAIYAT